MSRDEGSVMASLKKLYAEEDRRRTEQVGLAQRRKLEDERKQLEEDARRAEAARASAENERRATEIRAEAERSERDRQETRRAIELESVRSDIELRTRLALLQAEQAQELQRLALLRDARVKRLEGQRLLLGGAFVATLVGAIGIQLLVLHPGSRRQQAIFDAAMAVNGEQRLDFDRDRERWAMRDRELMGRVKELEAQQAAGQRPPPASEEHVRPHAPRNGGRTPQRPEGPTRCVDKNDPLCSSLD